MEAVKSLGMDLLEILPATSSIKLLVGCFYNPPGGYLSSLRLFSATL